MGEVVDIFGRTCKMDELCSLGSLDIVRKALSEPILDRLHVMIGPCLYELDRFRVSFRETRRKAVKFCDGLGSKRRRLSDVRCITQGLEPLYCQVNTVPDQREFTEVGP